VGNSKVFGDTVQNFSTNPYRRVGLVAPLGHSVDPARAGPLLKERLAPIPHLLTPPAPGAANPPFPAARPRLAVRPPVRQHPPLRAGGLRHQPPDPRELRRGRLSRPRAALPRAQRGRLSPAARGALGQTKRSRRPRLYEALQPGSVRRSAPAGLAPGVRARASTGRPVGPGAPARC